VTDSLEQSIARLMAEGLEHYGQDRVEKAVACWREVLARNPEHRVAREYLEAAGFPAEAEPSAAEAGSLLPEALSLLQAGQAVEALELLESGAAAHSEDLELQAHLELIRSHLFGHYRKRSAEGTAVPGVRLGPDEVLKFNLPASAGFLLSMIDGNTSVDDLVTLSGMDPFDALHVLAKLEDAGIVELQR